MGAALSSPSSPAPATLSAPLSAQFKFPVVVNQRFCTPRTVLLELSDGFSRAAGGGFAVTEARSARELLRLIPSAALPEALRAAAADGRDGDKWLLDGYGVAIARLRRVERRASRRLGATSHTLSYEVSVGTRAPRRLAGVQVALWTAPDAPSAATGRRWGPLARREPTLALEFEDARTGAQSRVGSAGDWESRRAAVLWVDRGGPLAARQAVAKAFRSDLDGLLGLTPSGAFREGNGFRVEVAPGVDAALVVLLCAAMDDAILRVDGGADGMRTAREAARGREDRPPVGLRPRPTVCGDACATACGRHERPTRSRDAIRVVGPCISCGSVPSSSF